MLVRSTWSEKSPFPKLRIGCSGDTGQGVFAEEAILQGVTVLIFQGPLLSESELAAVNEMYLQCGIDRFLGPSGQLDDFVNHSCEPNCYLSMADENLTLVALRDIKDGEEITFDYSTSTDEGSNWSMPCHCGSGQCRGIVTDWSLLPRNLRERYLSLGAVPEFIYKHTCRIFE